MQRSRKPGLKLRARRAAAYAKTPVLWTPTIPTVLSIIGTIELLVFFLFPELREVHFYDGNRGPLYHLADKIEVSEEEVEKKKKDSWWYKKELGGGEIGRAHV